MSNHEVPFVGPSRSMRGTSRTKFQLLGGWPLTPLKNDGVKVSWDDDIPNNYMESHKIHVPNHQPVSKLYESPQILVFCWARKDDRGHLLIKKLWLGGHFWKGFVWRFYPTWWNKNNNTTMAPKKGVVTSQCMELQSPPVARCQHMPTHANTTYKLPTKINQVPSSPTVSISTINQ